MQDIKELSLEQLKKLLETWQMPSYHAKQIFCWIYKRGVFDPLQMTDLPLNLRTLLKKNFFIFNLKLIKILDSLDGTKKFLFKLKDNNFIEAVIIPTEKRMTACISTQVGCKFKCKFCASGRLGFRRNLTCGEMLDELLFLKKNSFNKNLTHLVFMGIGEPLDNYDNVLKAIRIINSIYAFNLGARRITISTCGIIPGIKRLIEEPLQIELSISLHAPDDKTRTLLMPVNKIYPLEELMLTLKEYIKKKHRQITFEYVLIKDINSSLSCAENLVKILKPLKLVKVNLIAANPIKELNIAAPNKLEILLFKDYLLKNGINATLRRPRGQDIEASCGQLRLRYEKEA